MDKELCESRLAILRCIKKELSWFPYMWPQLQLPALINCLLLFISRFTINCDVMEKGHFFLKTVDRLVG